MKNLIKSGIIVLGIMISISSCSSCGNKGTTVSVPKTDSPKTQIDTEQKAVDTTKKAAVKTLKQDTVKK